MRHKEKLVIYLDFDGVLNNGDEYYGDSDNYHNFNICNVKAFSKMMDKFILTYGEENVRIVLNTAWKMTNPKTLIHRCKHTFPFKKYGKYINECTPTFNFFCSKMYRSKEYCIKGFEMESHIVKTFRDIDNIDILLIDDEEVLTRFSGVNIYRTNTKKGLTDEDIVDIMYMINESNKEEITEKEEI